MTPNNKSSSLLDRFFYNAFFYSEYVYRNIEINHKKLVEEIVNIKQILNQSIISECNIKEINSDILLDCLIDMYAFMNSDILKCNIFSGSIQSQLIDKTHNNDNDVFYFIVENIYNNIITEPILKNLIHDLTEKSLKEGIYITHIDNYRYDYDFNKLTNNDYSYLGKHLFFKKEDSLLEGTSYIMCEPNINDNTDQEELLRIIEKDRNYNPLFSCKEELNFDYFKKRSIKIYIDINNEEYNLKNSIEKVGMILAAYNYKKNDTYMDQSLYKALTNIFFSKGILRLQLEEIYNKLLGIFIWDKITYHNINIQDAYVESVNKYNIKKYIYKDEECRRTKLCTKECFRKSACKNQAQILYEVANLSILNKKIQTSRDR